MVELPDEVKAMIGEVLNGPKNYFAWSALEAKSKELGLRLFVFDPPPMALVLPEEEGIGVSDELAKGPKEALEFWIIYAKMKALNALMRQGDTTWDSNDKLRSYRSAYGLPTPQTLPLHNEVFSLKFAVDFWHRQEEQNRPADEIVDLLVGIEKQALLDAFVYLYWCDSKLMPSLRSTELQTWRTENESKLIRFFSEFVIFEENHLADFVSNRVFGSISKSLRAEEQGSSAYNITDFIELGIEAINLLKSVDVSHAEELYTSFIAAVEKFRSAAGSSEEQATGNTLAEIGARLFGWAEKAGIEALETGREKVDRHQFDEAEAFFKVACRLGQITKSLRLEALGLNSLGVNSSRQRQYDVAIRHFQDSLAISINNGFYEIASGSLDSIGIIETKRGEYKSAISYFEAALKAATNACDSHGQAAVLSNMSTALTRSGRLKESRSCLLNAINIADELGERRMKAPYLDNLGDVESVLGNYEEAIKHIEEAITIYHQADAPIDEYLALFNLASTYRSWGRPEDAERSFLRANDLLEVHFSTIAPEKYSQVNPAYSAPRKWREQQRQPRSPLPDDADEETLGKAFLERFGVTIVDMAAQEHGKDAQKAFDMGDLDTALSLWLQAANEYKSIGHDLPLAEALVNLSVTYSRLGDLDQGIASAENALEIFTKANFIWGEVSSLINLYRALIDSGRSGAEQDGYMYLVRAARLLEIVPQVIALSGNDDFHSAYLERKGTILANRGNVARRFSATDFAVSNYRQALELAEETGNKYRICGRLSSLAGRYAELGDIGAFNEAIDRASSIARQENFLDVLIHCSSMRIQLLAQSALPNELVEPAKEWLDLVDKLREEAPNIRLRTLVKTDIHPIYDLVVRIAKDVKSPQLVWDFLERIKARAVLDAVSTFRSLALPANGEHADLIKEEGDLIKKRKVLDRILFNSQLEDSEDSIRARYTASEERKEITTRLEAVWNQLEEQAPGIMTWRRGAPIASDIVDKLLETEPDALFLNYYLFGDGFIIAAASRQLSEVQLYEYHDEQSKLTDLRLAFQEEIKEASRFSPPATNWNELSAIIISPILELLERVTFSKIIFIPDGFLTSLPFAAISFQGGALIDKYEVKQIPNASALFYLNAHSRDIGPSFQKSLVFGNPSGDLAFAEEEAKLVAGILNAPFYLNEACSKETLLSLSNDARVIHLACHGYFDTDVAERSGILLAHGDVLSASELGSLTLNNALVTISACESGKLKEREGSELTGLYVNLFEAGASAVVASLWKVNDRSTMILMQRFYERWKEGHSISASLRHAQTSLKRDHPEFNHPFHWAPFVLVGADLMAIN